MKFGTNKVMISGWTAEQTADYINNQLKNDEIKFSEQLINNIYSITGGIPLLLNLAANYAYDYIAQNGGEDGLKFSALYNKEIVQTLLFRWCKLINPEQVTALRHLIEGTYDNELDSSKLRGMQQRGLLNFRVEFNKTGDRKLSDKDYDFCCRLFGIFCNDSTKLECAAENNPLKTPVIAQSVSQSAKDKYIKSADKMKKDLEIQLNDAYSEAKNEYDEYRKLGKRISEKSARLNKFRTPMDRAIQLRETVTTTFSDIKTMISNATGTAELETIIENANITYNDLKLKTDELVQSIKNG